MHQTLFTNLQKEEEEEEEPEEDWCVTMAGEEREVTFKKVYF